MALVTFNSVDVLILVVERHGCLDLYGVVGAPKLIVYWMNYVQDFKIHVLYVYRMTCALKISSLVHMSMALISILWNILTLAFTMF